ncbi:S8 family serine peptidase [Haliangium ochraceum]|nr:S8 family serine peptidase [Haliangium ochraceum]
MFASGCVVGDHDALSDSDIGSEQSALSEVSPQGRYLVKFKNAAGRSAIHAAGGQVAMNLEKHGLMAMYLPDTARKGLLNNPNIEYVEPDPVRKLATATPYGLGMVQADQVIADTSSPVAADLTVCIIDSGIKADHPEFAGLEVAGTQDSSATPFSDDLCGHGTHVAGTVAGATVGVAPDAVGIYAVKVFEGADCGWSFASGLIGALDACEAAGAKVVSMSLGGSVKSRSEERAFADANGRGVLSIAAAGNDGNTRMSYPASYDSVMSVAALDEAGAIATFSQQNSQVEIAAPGVAVDSAYPYESSLTVGGTKYAGKAIEFAALGNVSGAVVDGGLCDSVGSFAGAVVMCERGAISFFDKVANAQAGGAAAAVIYNNAPGNFDGTLGEGNTSTIPAISLSQEDGGAIVASLLGTTGTVNSGLGDGYAALDGTSMATPHVSGVAAAIWSRVPDATNNEVRAALNATAIDLGAAGRDDAFGNGLVQAKAALDFLKDGGGGGECLPAGASCSADADCCSAVCSGRGKNKSCQ